MEEKRSRGWTVAAAQGREECAFFIRKKTAQGRIDKDVQVMEVKHDLAQVRCWDKGKMNKKTNAELC